MAELAFLLAVWHFVLDWDLTDDLVSRFPVGFAISRTEQNIERGDVVARSTAKFNCQPSSPQTDRLGEPWKADFGVGKFK